MTDAEQAAFYERAGRGRGRAGTEYGFVGRDLDIQAIERAAAAGPGHATCCWCRAWPGRGSPRCWAPGLVVAAHRPGRAGLPVQLRGPRLDRRPDHPRDPRASSSARSSRPKPTLMPAAAQLEQVAELLRARRHLLILDNTESITAAPAAIPHALTRPSGSSSGLPGPAARRPDPGAARLPRSRGLARHRHASAPTSTRCPAWTPKPPPCWSTGSCTATAPPATLDDDHRTQALQELIDAARRVPAAADRGPARPGRPHPPTEVLADLQRRRHGADPAGLISRAIEYSHGKLDPALRTRCCCSPPSPPSSPPVLSSTATATLLRARRRAGPGPGRPARRAGPGSAVGLAAPHPQLGDLGAGPAGAALLPAQPPAGQPALRRHSTKPTTSSTANSAARCTDCSPSPENPQQRATGQAATRAEYANLTTALDHGLHQPARRRLILRSTIPRPDPSSKRPADSCSTRPSPPTQPGQPGPAGELAYLHHLRGMAAHDQHRLDDAKRPRGNALRHSKQLEIASGMALHLPSARQRRPGAAAVRRRRSPTGRPSTSSWSSATGIAPPAPTTSSAASPRNSGGSRRPRPLPASPRHLLEFGDRHTPPAPTTSSAASPRSSGGSTEAETNYRQALDIYLEFGDRHGAASTYHQLGTVAQEQRRFDEAEASYRKPSTSTGFDDRHGAASTYHQLGSVAQDQRRFEEAEANYRKALDIFLEFGDRHGAASTYHQLGTLAQEQRRFAKPKPATAKPSTSTANPTREPRQRRPPCWALCSQSLASTARRHAPSSTPQSHGTRKPGNGPVKTCKGCGKNARSSDPMNSPAW